MLFLHAGSVPLFFDPGLELVGLLRAFQPPVPAESPAACKQQQPQQSTPSVNADVTVVCLSTLDTDLASKVTHTHTHMHTNTQSSKCAM